MADDRDSHSIETFTGRFVSYDEAQHDLVLADVAHALAQICRYTGHVRKFYSVAEHAVRVAEKLSEWGASPAVRLGGLHHDDAEAYVGDMNKPLKDSIGEAYRKYQRHFDDAVWTALELPDLTGDDHDLIKQADIWALGYEAYYLLPSQGFRWHDLTGGQYNPNQDLADHGHMPIGWTPQFAEMMYLTLHRVLT